MGHITRLRLSATKKLTAGLSLERKGQRRLVLAALACRRCEGAGGIFTRLHLASNELDRNGYAAA